MISRRALVTAVAASSTSAGIGWAWWQAAAKNSEQPNAPGDLWNLRFERPDGGEVALSNFKGRPLVLNFWATWCPPCVHELPLLDRFYRQFNSHGWEVLGLAVEDNRALVQSFLAKQPVSFTVGLAGIRGITLSRSLGNGQGALPFSVGFNRHGQLSQRKLGVLTLDELRRWVTESS